MAEKPILFSGPMVRAILEGRKTQTRRMIKPQPELRRSFGVIQKWMYWAVNKKRHIDVNASFFEIHAKKYCPYGQAGDSLWVRESFGIVGNSYIYRAGVNDEYTLNETTQFVELDTGLT